MNYGCLGSLVLAVSLGAAASCGSKKDDGTRSGTSHEVPELVAADKEALVAEMIRNARPPEVIERIWDATCDDVGVFTLAQGCLPMLHSRVRSWAGRLYLVLGPNQAPTCDRRKGPHFSDTQPVLSVMLPPGARRESARGRPVGAQSSLEYPGGKSISTNAGPSRVTLDPGPFGAGRRVTGALSIDGVGAGRFSAELCPDDFAAVWEGPELKPADTLTVTVGGRPYPATTTLFFTSSFGRYTILNAGIFDEKADCTTPTEQSVGVSVITLTEPPPFELIGTEQPAHAVHLSVEQRAVLQAYGWGIWDEVSTEPGGHVRARVHVVSEPHQDGERSLSVSGPIEGTVCPSG